jgi:hypothetical protein
MTEARSILVNRQMAEPHPHWTNKLVSSLPARIGLVFLTTGVIAGTSPFVFLANRFVSPSLLRLVVVIALGVVAGFTARQLMRSNTYLLRLTTAWIALFAGLVLLGFLTSGYAGVNLVSKLTANPYGVGLGQFTLGSIAAWLALQAWKGSLQGKRTPTPSASNRSKLPAGYQPGSKKLSPFKSKLVRRTKKASRLVGLKSPAFLSRRFWRVYEKNLAGRLVQWKKHIYTTVEKSTHWAGMLLVQSWARLNTEKQSVRTKIRLKRYHPGRKIALKRHTLVKLAGRTENRCPYCLEVVHRSDPRGVKICPVCHTYHHADCWAVTGTCQVPHYHE